MINPAWVSALGVAAGRWLNLRAGGGPRSPILIGRDTRHSGAVLERAVAAGFAAEGWTAQSLGVLPTPAVARAVRETGAPLGVVITASHNPAADNGIKFFGPEGRKLTEAQELEIERLLPESPPAGSAEEVPTVSGAMAEYMAMALRLLPQGSLEGWRIAVDTAHGATCATGPLVFRTLGAEVAGLGDAPDGHNINAGVGSEHATQLALRVRETGARLGVAFDGDGDRCVLCDEMGAVLDGDEVLAILALHALGRGKLPGGTLVVTVLSNLGVDAAIVAAGGRVLRTPVGDRHVAERMAAEGAVLGGESSGHIIFSEISPTGDGLVGALKVIEVMLATGQPLSVLRGALKKFPQASRALAIREKKPLETLPGLSAAIRALEIKLGKQGRVLVRYSGTESKIRLLVEGPDEATVQTGLASLESAAREELT